MPHNNDQPPSGVQSNVPVSYPSVRLVPHMLITEEVSSSLPDIRRHPYDTTDFSAGLARRRVAKITEGGLYDTNAKDIRSIPERDLTASGTLKPETASSSEWSTLRGTWELEYDPENHEVPIIARAIGVMAIPGYIYAGPILSIGINRHCDGRLQSDIVDAVVSRGMLAVIADISLHRSHERMGSREAALQYEEGKDVLHTHSADLQWLYASERPYRYTDMRLPPGSMTTLEGYVTHVRQHGSKQDIVLDTGKAKKKVTTGILKFRQQQVDKLTEAVPETDRQPMPGDWLQLRSFVVPSGDLIVDTPGLTIVNEGIRQAYYLSHVE